MKQKISNEKTTQHNSSAVEQSPSTGAKAIAIAPPDYGIDSVDNQVIQTMSAPENKTGLPNRLKTGVESLSGYSLDDVRVHYNSSKPAKLNALAYTQGTEIHVAPGQERYMPHEAWHIVQQKQGRVKPTMQMKGGININDDKGLEKEADVMGAKAFQLVDNRPEAIVQRKLQMMMNLGRDHLKRHTHRETIVQGLFDVDSKGRGGISMLRTFRISENGKTLVRLMNAYNMNQSVANLNNVSAYWHAIRGNLHGHWITRIDNAIRNERRVLTLRPLLYQDVRGIVASYLPAR